MRKHTPIPWKMNDYGELRGADGKQIVVSALGIAHSCVKSDIGEANTAFIIRAANNHDRLMEILRIAVEETRANSTNWVQDAAALLSEIKQTN